MRTVSDFEQRICDERPETAAALARLLALARRVEAAGFATIEVKEGRDVLSLKAISRASKASFWVAYVDARPMPAPSGYQPVIHGSVLRRVAPGATLRVAALLPDEFSNRPQFSCPPQLITDELLSVLEDAYHEAAAR